MCWLEKIRPWLNDPNKSWFRLWKFVLTIIRGLVFLLFCILSIYFSTPYYDQSLIFPKIAFICLLIFNWRFIISLLLLGLLLLAKTIQLVSSCICIGFVTNRFLVGFKKLVKSALSNLNWSQIDWPCFLNLKYYIYYLDALHYFVFLTVTVVVFFVEHFVLESNFSLLIVFVINSVFFFTHVAIEVFRIVQAKRVEQTIRDIFVSDLTFSTKARAMISESQLNSCTCANFSHCSLIDSHHRALAHPMEIFTRSFKEVSFNKRGINLTIGFHQTTIEASRSILTTGFKPSKTGMLGPGIYFATNYNATDFKRNQSTEGGAIFCAVLDIGRVCEVFEKSDAINYSRHFNSKYLRHGAGSLFDEFVVYNENQVLEYTIIVEQRAIDSFRARNERPFCDCI